MNKQKSKYNLCYYLSIIMLIILHIKIDGQQKICLGSKKKYSVDFDQKIYNDESYSWYINSAEFKGSIKTTNPKGNEVEIDWKDTDIGTYRLEVSKKNSCSSVISILDISLQNSFELNIPSVFYQCPINKLIKIDAPKGYTTYKWINNNEKVISLTDTFETDKIGKYTLIVSDGDCQSTLNFEIFEYHFPQIKISNSGLNNILVQINTIEAENYLFQLVDLNLKVIRNWQSSSIFNNIKEGEYIVNIKSKLYDCIINLNSRVYAIPNLITPNNDGYNDIWDLSDFQNIKSVLIFDRYGKKIKTINYPEIMKWDGKIDGKNIPTSTYWYQILLNDDQTVSGSLTLIN